MKILYLMNTNWGWIKQRPHFLAEGLSELYDVTIAAPVEYHKTTANARPSNLKLLFRLPFQTRSRIMSYLNRYVMGIQIWFLSRKCDVIWIASPLQYAYVRYSCRNKRVIYDCMDDQEELQKSPRLRNRVRANEKALYSRADMVISSSHHLRQVLCEKYGERKIEVVNNALADGFEKMSGECLNSDVVSFDHNYKNITYIGTISSWLDFDFLLCILESNPNVKVNLVGPVDCEPRPRHERLVFHGPVQHRYVLPIMKESDILIMPFIVNELIQSVNPVKLYEYIFSGKPCMAPYYGESSYFASYVHLYHDKEEGCRMVESLLSEGPLSEEARIARENYALSNTWSSRVYDIDKIIGEYGFSD